jgi:hypothetical protein
MTLAEEEAEVRAALVGAWERLPEAFHGPTQFLGRHYAGCGATIGAMPKCASKRFFSAVARNRFA